MMSTIIKVIFQEVLRMIFRIAIEKTWDFFDDWWDGL